MRVDDRTLNTKARKVDVCVLGWDPLLVTGRAPSDIPPDDDSPLATSNNAKYTPFPLSPSEREKESVKILVLK